MTHIIVFLVFYYFVILNCTICTGCSSYYKTHILLPVCVVLWLCASVCFTVSPFGYLFATLQRCERRRCINSIIKIQPRFEPETSGLHYRFLIATLSVPPVPAFPRRDLGRTSVERPTLLQGRTDRPRSKRGQEVKWRMVILFEHHCGIRKLPASVADAAAAAPLHCIHDNIIGLGFPPRTLSSHSIWIFVALTSYK